MVRVTQKERDFESKPEVGGNIAELRRGCRGLFTRAKIEQIETRGKEEGKAIPVTSVEAHRFVRCRDSHIF
jgi:hypothetical protein